MNKVQFAAALRRDRKTVQRWENGENEPCFGDLQKMEELKAKAARGAAK